MREGGRRVVQNIHIFVYSMEGEPPNVHEHLWHTDCYKAATCMSVRGDCNPKFSLPGLAN